MSQTSNYDYLASTDRKRIVSRSEYRDKISQAANSVRNGSYIYIPKSVIGKDNIQLRRGLPWLYNGFVIGVDDMVLAVDPGVNFVLRLTESGFDLSSINHVFLSHLHLDHTADANTLLEWSIRSRKNTKVLAPKSVFDTGAISEFHAGISSRFPANHSSEIINGQTVVDLFANRRLCFIEMKHGVECYGFILNTPMANICYVSDTCYAQQVLPKGATEFVDINNLTEPTEVTEITKHHKHIKQAVKSADILIANVDSFLHNKNSRNHLSVIDLLHMVKDSQVKKIIIVHLNPVGELDYEHWGSKIAHFVADQTGIDTSAISPEGYNFNF